MQTRFNCFNVLRIEVTAIASVSLRRPALQKLRWAIAFAALLGCHRKEPRSDGDPIEATGLAALNPEIADKGNIPAGFALNRQKLDRYLDYQRRLVPIYSELMKGMSQGGPASTGASGRAATTSPESGATLKRLAIDEERAREASGLSTQELEAIDRIVRDVIGRRLYGGTAVEEESVHRMEMMKAKLPTQLQAETGRAIDEIRKSQESVKWLKGEREKYGSSNVDLVLSREAELAQTWRATLGAFIPTARK